MWGEMLKRWAIRCVPVAVALCLAALSAAGQTASDLTRKKAAAQAQFERAVKAHAALETKPAETRTVADYQGVVSAYQHVFHTTPHAPQATAALKAAAELYREMGSRFDSKYYRSAVDTYQFLVHEYPGSRHLEAALFAVAEIQQQGLKDVPAARLAWEDFLRRFPGSPSAEQARAALAGLRDSRRVQRGSREVAQRSLTGPAQPPAHAESRPQARVTNIRHWNAERYTRVVVDMEGEVSYQSARILNPDRIYFDLHTARLSPALSERLLKIGDGFLKSIRVAQNQAGTVRVVLDVEKVKDYSAFVLSNPFRLVIDVYGEARAPRASAARPADAPEAPQPAAQSKEATPAAKQTPVVAQAADEKPPETPAKLPAQVETASGAPAAPVNLPQPNRNGRHSLTRALGLKVSRIVIDPGHGGHDTGTIGPTGLMEKDLCLDLALRLGRLIEERLPGAEVLYTRADDSYLALEARTILANEAKADMFISIHANSSPEVGVRGVETYYLSLASSPDAMQVAARENALSQASVHELEEVLKKIAASEKVQESRELASAVQSSLAARLQRVSRQIKNRGVRRAPFVVLIGANMPSVLTEISFLSNPREETILKKPEHRQRVAEGLFAGVEKYLRSVNSLTSLSARQQPGGVER